MAIVQGGSTVKATAQDVADLAGAPYLVYTALLTQSGTSAPVATVLQNTLGTVTYSYNSLGNYNINLPSSLVEKTFVQAIAYNSAGGGSVSQDAFIIQRSSLPNPNSLINLKFSRITSNGVGTITYAQLDDNWTGTIEIRVYP